MSTDEQPSIVDNPDAGRYEILIGDEVAGFVQYTRRGTALSLTHTEVRAEFEGRGLGSRLARGVLDMIRADGGEVLPSCPFIRHYIEGHPEYLDLVPVDQRARYRLDG